jgi:hypothetical protein
MKIHNSTHKNRVPRMIYRIPSIMTLFTLTLLGLSVSFLLSSPLTISFAQLSSSPETMPSQEVQGANELAGLEAARQQYLSAWNNTAFASQFDVFIAEGSDSGYGIYREHLPASVFRPGETIVLYVEPVGYGHQPITDASAQDGVNSTTTATLYLVNMTVDIIISDASGSQVETLEDLPGGSFYSHRQNTEFPLVVTLSQEQPFPVGDYIVTYVVNDQVTGQSFQIDRGITIDDAALTGAAPLPGTTDDNSMQELLPQQQLEERSQELEP